MDGILTLESYRDARAEPQAQRPDRRANEGQNAGAGREAQARRATGKAAQAVGLSTAEVTRFIAPLQGLGKKKINVAATFADLPAAAQTRFSNDASAVRGAFMRDTDEVWLVAANLNSAEEALFVALHEQAHRGLLKTFGDDLRPILNQIYLTNENVRAAAGTAGLTLVWLVSSSGKLQLRRFRQFGDAQTQGAGDFHERQQRDVVVSTLDAARVAPVNLGYQRQAFLADSLLKA